MPIKIVKSDSSPQGNRRKVVASGGVNHAITNISDTNHKYATGKTVHLPITKNAQFAGAGANVIFTQPMFFSPLHTPQNWQIASKRREIYQWCFISPCNLTSYDGSIIDISEVYNTCIPTSSYTTKFNDNFLTLNGQGDMKMPDVLSCRWKKDKANKIKVMGTAEPLIVTHDHQCIVIKKQDLVCRKNRWNSKKCVHGMSSPTCLRHKCCDYKEKDYTPVSVNASDVENGDYMLIPINDDIHKSIIDSVDKARYAGHLASDGSVSEERKNVRVCMNDDDIPFVYPYIVNIHKSYGASENLLSVSTIQEMRSSLPELYNLASKLVTGKYENKKFTEEVLFLDPKLQLHVIGAYIQSDGSWNQANSCVEITSYSPHLANQLLMMCYRCRILARVNKQPISSSKSTFHTNNVYRYIVNIPTHECHKIAEYVPGKVPNKNYDSYRINNRFFWKNFVVAPVQSNESFDYEGDVYDIREPITNTIVVNGIAVHNCRFYYENEAKVAAGVDFYCFEPSTQILLEDGSQKSISSIEEGDAVRSHDGTANRVLEVHCRDTQREDMLSISISGISQGPLKVTPGHKIFIRQGKTRKEIIAGELKAGNDVVSFHDKIKNCFAKVKDIKTYKYTGKLYDLTIENTHTYIANRIAVHNSTFPMNGFKLECKDPKVLKFYEKLVKSLRLNHWLKAMSLEYHMLGDVYPFTEIECKHCNSTGVLSDGQPCNHPGGKIKRIVVLNPDWIEVQKNVLASEPVISLVPDEELRMIVQRKQPREIFDRLPASLVNLVASGKPIPLSNRCISHIAYNESPYGAYGTSMLRRLFTVLAYKTKLMTANWIIAERLIIPIRVVKVGDKDRPASAEDIQDTSNQLAAVANDPNVTIVTHHAFCHDEDTEVLTKDGFKKFPEITVNDDVCVFNKNNESCFFENPKKVHVFNYDGDMIKITGKRLNMNLTSEHRMLIRRPNGNWQDVLAKNLKTNMRTRSVCNGFVNNIMYPVVGAEGDLHVDIGCELIEVDAFLRLAGYYLSEGSLNLNKVIVYQSSKKQESFQNIEKAFDNFGHKYSKRCYRKPDSYEFVIYSKELQEFFEKHFGRGAKSKIIPTWIKELPAKHLETFIQAMKEGDGSDQSGHNTKACLYTSASKILIDDLQQVVFKCGYGSHVYWDKHACGFSKTKGIWRLHFSRGFASHGAYPIIRKHNIKRQNYKGKVYCLSTSTGYFVTRRNGHITIQGNSMDYIGATGKIHNITAELEEIGKEILDGLMLNQALLNGEASSYSSAQVGVETLIRRLDSWRAVLAEWVENHIFLPTAMMQGFTDEEESKEMGEDVYLIPTIKWNDMNLRDKSNWYQLMMQLHDKQIISTQKLLEEFDISYDQEVERIREEQLNATGTGQVMGGPGGGGAPMPGMGGGGGGMPPMPGGLGGMPPGGAGGGMGIPGGEGAAPPGGGAAPTGGMGMGAPGAGTIGAGGVPEGIKIGKKGKGGKSFEQQVQGPQPKMIRLTSLERKLYKILQSLDIPHQLYAQYQVHMMGQQQPYLMDFAYPSIGVGIESDGAAWHDRLDLKEKDKQRDQKLASIGWRILRFKEDALNSNPEGIKDVIHHNILEAVKDRSKKTKKSDSNEEIKLASVGELLESDKTVCEKYDLPNNIGYIWLIGEAGEIGE